MKLLGKILLALGLMVAPSWAALPSTIVFEVESLAAANGSGCFDSAKIGTGTDWSQQAAVHTAYTDLVAVSATTISSAGNPFQTSDTGNCIKVVSGTGWTAGLYEITSVSASVATVDSAIATMGSTGGVANLGGSIASLPGVNARMVSGSRAWVKADGTYSISSKVTFNYVSSLPTWIAGYTTTRGDGGSFTVQASTSLGDRMIDLTTHMWLRNIILDANSQSVTGCLYFLQAEQVVENMECKNSNYSSHQVRMNNILEECLRCWVHDWISAQPAIAFNNVDDLCIYCVVGSSSVSSTHGFDMIEGHCSYCIVYGLTGTTSDGFTIGNTGLVTIDHCVVHNVTRDAIRITAIWTPLSVTNCILSSAVNGIDNVSGTTLQADDIGNDYNFTYNMSGSDVVGLTAGTHSVILTRTPFINAGSLDFRLNNNFGGGASVRAHGIPNGLPGITGTGYPDAGGIQHQDPKFFQ